MFNQNIADSLHEDTQDVHTHYYITLLHPKCPQKLPQSLVLSDQQSKLKCSQFTKI